MKFFYMLAWVCLCWVSAQAQQDSAKIRIGALAGLNICPAGYQNFFEDTHYTLMPVILYHAGVRIDLPVKRNISAFGEVVFNRMGNRIVLNNLATIQETTYDRRASFLDCAIMMKYNIHGLGIYAGTKMGLMLGENNSIHPLEDGNRWQDIHLDQRKMFFSLVGGLEYTHNNGVGLYVRCTIALNNRRAGSTNPYSAPNPEISLRAFQSGVYYRI